MKYTYYILATAACMVVFFIGTVLTQLLFIFVLTTPPVSFETHVEFKLAMLVGLLISTIVPIKIKRRNYPDFTYTWLPWFISGAFLFGITLI